MKTSSVIKSETNEMKIHVCSFASSSFLRQQKCQADAWINMGIEESRIHLLGPESLDSDFFADLPYAAESNKFGFYSFKPYFLLKVLNCVDENDVLIYLDVNDRPLIGFDAYISNQMRKRAELNLIAASTNYPNFRRLSWFHSMRMPLLTKISSVFLFQPEAGCLILRNNSETQKILRAWYALTTINSDAMMLQFDPESRLDQETLFFLSLINNSIKFESWYLYRIFKIGLRKYVDWEFYRDE